MKTVKRYERMRATNRQPCTNCGNAAMSIYMDMMTNETVIICKACAENGQADFAFPYELNLRKNVRNSLPKRLPDLLGGREIEYGHHAWAGLSNSPIRLEKLTGGEHRVFVAAWRADELRKQGFSLD